MYAFGLPLMLLGVVCVRTQQQEFALKCIQIHSKMQVQTASNSQDCHIQRHPRAQRAGHPRADVSSGCRGPREKEQKDAFPGKQRSQHEMHRPVTSRSRPALKKWISSFLVTLAIHL